ncbi:serine/threonine-protein kinase [Actinomadura viridis]|uniref:serine/threonine-protein kinase n=1 Tax=Actinomadura viridis TaxID=58110 RepID=UPI0036A4D7E3
MEALRPEDPRAIGSYRVLARLGAGGMGRVFVGRSPGGRTVAIKLVHPELARDPEFRRRFRSEVRAAREVGGEFTAPVLDADTESGTPWLATGFIAGPTLHEVVEEGYGPLPERTARFLAGGLASALRAVHGAGLVHRDLKPSNVLLTLDGPRVIDFGIARAVDSSVATRTGSVIGTPAFMSPEQVRGERAGPASDVFSLGAVLAYAVTGRQAFATPDGGVHALMMRVVSAEPDLEGMREPLRGLVAACLAKDPAGRPSLDEIVARAATEDGGDGEPWLPAELLAQLGRHAVRLLDLEQPDAPADDAATRRFAGEGGPLSPTRAFEPSGTTPPPRPTPPPGPPPRTPPPHGTPPPHTPPPGAAPPPYGLPPRHAGYPPGTLPPGPRTTQPPPRPASPRSPALPIALVAVASLFIAAVVIAVSVADRKGKGDPAVAGTDGVRSTRTPSKKPSKKPSAKGDVPKFFLGTWEGTISGPQKRRMVIRQGRRGQDVVSTRTTSSRAECRGSGVLVEAGERSLVLRTRVTGSDPAGACSSIGRQTLTRVDENTLRYRAGLSDGTLRRKN